ncbi:peptide-methionine (S)-S-oxide reductase MsrA [Roseiconus nitratireducens]|uniref:Peptide methionine sulfoxide reductase MsrA n=2 Tax=Roseiconus nitratireducens TaxID=2605748 RepID=A0A5M6CZA2_9BACT|nr:peptide-methionine (S)-S-oxide reductase MsrA [Roseiconus nitratireducens]
MTRLSALAAAVCCLAVLFGCDVNAQTQASGDSTVAASEPESSTSSDSADSESANKEQVATLAGGCFWCTEAVFERMEGVNDVVSGYIGGTVPNPTYEQVCSKQTGHAEAVEIYYDPAKVKYEELLEVFFKTHDPTTLNKQGADEGPQYRSSIFVHDDKQREIAEQYIKQLDASDAFNRKIVTKIEKATTFYPAEEYHQDFYRRNPNYGYCQAVVASKVRKFNRNFGDKIKQDAK